MSTRQLKQWTTLIVHYGVGMDKDSNIEDAMGWVGNKIPKQTWDVETMEASVVLKSSDEDEYESNQKFFVDMLFSNYNNIYTSL